MRLMYLSLLIYTNECLRHPNSLTMSFGRDLEKHRDEMECGELFSSIKKCKAKLAEARNICWIYSVEYQFLMMCTLYRKNDSHSNQR